MGYRYVLAAINGPSHYVLRSNDAILAAVGRDIWGYRYVITNDRRASFWTRTATDTQMQTWPELASFVGNRFKPSLLWVLESEADRVDDLIENLT